MAIGSGIEWTEATWNPSTGCTKISPGCKNCYAETLTKRLKAMKQRKYKKGFEFEHHSDIHLPLTWKKIQKRSLLTVCRIFFMKNQPLNSLDVLPP